MVTRTGYTRFPSTNYKTSKHCVAYLDILGTKNKIYEDKNADFLNHLNMFCKDAISEASSAKYLAKDNIFVKIFSDNMLFAINTENDKMRLDRITAMFCTIANLQNEILNYGHLIRGAIVEGEFFHNDIIVYGKALVEAVNIEENIAEYPRIIVAQNIIAKDLWQYIFKDIDGLYFLNNLAFDHSLGHIGIKLQLLEILKKHKDNIRIKKKIMWAISYFNEWFKSPYYRGWEKPQITNEDVKGHMV